MASRLRFLTAGLVGGSRSPSQHRSPLPGIDGRSLNAWRINLHRSGAFESDAVMVFVELRDPVYLPDEHL